MTESYFENMAALARMGFPAVPQAMTHYEKGPGLLYMDGAGVRFEPFDRSPPLCLTWEQFDNGPPAPEQERKTA